MRSAFLLCLLTACQDTAQLNTGTWELQGASDTGTDVPDVSIELDMERETATFLDADGAVIDYADLTLWARGDWPVSCPTNLSGTRQQVASVELDELTLSDITIVEPVLVADCPDGMSMVLRDGGTLGAGARLAAGPCMDSTTCLTFR